MSTPEQNKETVLRAFDTLFRKRDYAAAKVFWSEDHLQHSRHIPPGREGVFNIDRLGFDAAIDYRRDDFPDQLRDRTPRYVDVFFDNVGGDILDQALTRLARGARVVISGAISQYDNADAVVGPSNYLTLLYRSASVAGVAVPAFADRYPEAMTQMSHWLADGQLTSIEDTVHGDIETFPATLRRLFTGENTGKLVLELAHQT